MVQPIVIIISGNRSQADLLRVYFLKQGFQVLITSSGAEVQKLIAQAHPQLILLDWDLPDVSALALIRALRSQPQYSRLPIVLFGREISCENRVLSLEAGVDICLDGTVYPKELAARVRALLRRAELTSHHL